MLVEDGHGALGQPGAYRRLRVKCPVHDRCGALRSFSARFGWASGLGDQEPFAFLGCWLRAASTYPDDAETPHAAWKPSVREVQAYAQSMGWASSVGQ